MLDPYVGARGRRRTVTLSPAMARRLGVADDDLVEMIGRNPAPLRAWVVIAADHAEDTVRLDAFGGQDARCQRRGRAGPARGANARGSKGARPLR